MKYWMRFYNNDRNLMASSDNSFNGKDFDIIDFKERFNNEFVRNNKAWCCEMCFVHNEIVKKLVAGFRGKTVVVCDADSDKEYSISQFRDELQKLQDLFSNNVNNNNNHVDKDTILVKSL